MLARVIAWSLENRFLVCVLSLVLTLLGGWSMVTLPTDAIPDLSDVQVIVHTSWPGNDPQTVEDQVTYPISTKLLNVARVRDVRGFSFFGLSFVYAVFEDGTDPYWARSRVLEQISQARAALPDGVEPALGPDASGLGWVYIYTLEDTLGTHDLGQLRALQDWFVRYQLSSVSGVAEVASLGGAVRQFQVTIDPHALATFELPLARVVHAIRRSNGDVGGRLVEMAETEYMVRGRGYLRSIEDLEDVALGVDPAGTPILLRQVATVEIGPDLKRGIAEKDGRGEVVAGIVTMRYGENALEVIDAVKAKIAEIQAGLPEGVVIRTAYDRSGLIDRSIRTLSKQLIEELIVVVLVCLIFLWHARSALVAAVTLPVAILLSFIAMRALGINANIMSLGGIAVAIGAMVDASVVMVENLHKQKELHPDETDHWKLVRIASQEVGPALFFSLLVITIAFLPVFALQDQAGRLFSPLAWTKTFAMASAALVALILMPVLMGFFVRGRVHAESRNPVSRAMIAVYRPVLDFALRFRALSILIAIGCLALTLLPFRKLGSEFMPPLREGDILFMPTTLPGISSTEARRTLQIQDRLLADFPEVDVVLGKIGRADTPLDPAPLAMVETHATLYPEERWPERIVETDWLEDRAAELVDLALDEGLATAEVDDAAAQTARMTHAAVTRDVRERLMAGETMDRIEPELPAAVAARLALDLQELLASEGALAEGGDLVATLVPAFDVGDVPLRRTTFDELTRKEMDAHLSVPGMPNWWLMPIETRIGMLTTGMKGLVGLKVYGSDLAELQAYATALESLLRDVPGTSSVVAERALGGRYLDIDIDRRACARHGLTVGDVQDVIQTAIGGMQVTSAVDGRARHPVILRYPRELRDDPVKLGRTLVPTPSGAQIPLEQIATLTIAEGPPIVKSENGLLLTNVPIDLEQGVDVGSYVERAQAAIDEAVAAGELRPPAGTYPSWSGQYELMEDVAKRLRLLVPITLAIIFLLIYLNVRSVGETFITMVTLPFALIGGVWLLYFLEYDLSVATGIGFIALAGLAAETAIIMHVYLDLAFEKRREGGRVPSVAELREAVVEGAVLRVRPKMMTVMTTILALVPILWATGAGSGPMKRMAAPMIGGLVTSTIHTLILIPVYYAMVQEWRLRRRAQTS